jgi:formimidoylglutamate deiminase
VPRTLALPGFVDAHSHAFQRALRGSAPGGDFWAWRDGMIAHAESVTVTEIRREYADVYRELRSNGYTAVGEFHYLGLDEARAAAAAAAEAGIAFVCLYACYLRGGSPRFRQESVTAYLHELETLRDEGIGVGVAPHSVRACPAPALAELGRYAAAHGLPLHIHADEQAREIDECLAEHGLRPIELLDREGCLSPATTIVHATHADGHELDLLAAAGSRICVCPTTESNLGDGFLPVARVEHRAVPLCIGSDSNVRIDPLEELRELEGIGRRQTGRRGIYTVDALLGFGSAEGAAALGLTEWPDALVDLDDPQLRGVAEEGRYEALLFGCSSSVLRYTSTQ